MRSRNAKQICAFPDLRISRIALGGDGDCHDVERELVEKFIAHLRPAAVDRLLACVLRHVQFSPSAKAVDMPISPAEAPAFCWRKFGWFAFQPKRPSEGRFCRTSHTRLTRPGYAVAILVGRIGQGFEGCIGYGLQQTETDDRRSHARRCHYVRPERAIGKIGDFIARAAHV